MPFKFFSFSFFFFLKARMEISKIKNIDKFVLVSFKPLVNGCFIENVKIPSITKNWMY